VWLWAFLHSLKIQSECIINGIDYSKPLIEVAQNNLKGNFSVKEANSEWNLTSLMDVIVSHSVFNYFPDIPYTYDVIERAFLNLEKGGCFFLMDCNDVNQKENYHSERKKQYENPDQYDEKYKNHPHLFFNKDELVFKMKCVGFKSIEFFEYPTSQYSNQKFRFNLMAVK